MLVFATLVGNLGDYIQSDNRPHRIFRLSRPVRRGGGGGGGFEGVRTNPLFGWVYVLCDGLTLDDGLM